MSQTIYIARCPVHGLHGARDHCFECGAPAEQIEMIPATRVDAWLEQWKTAFDKLLDGLVARASLAPGGTRWPAFELPREHCSYALLGFEGETVYAGGADVDEARAALKEELRRRAWGQEATT